MSEDAALGWNLQPRDDVVEQTQQAADHSRIVAHRIDADAGVAGSQQDAVQNRRGDPLGVVERMVGLQPHAHPTNRVAKGGAHFAFFRDQDEVLIAHQL